jgi:hypothetical protein
LTLPLFICIEWLDDWREIEGSMPEEEITAAGWNVKRFSPGYLSLWPNYRIFNEMHENNFRPFNVNY